MMWLVVSAVLLGSLLAFASLVALSSSRGGHGRVRRLARMGRLSARLSASFVGARVRRALAPASARTRIDGERRRADAARVAQTMGEMKGAFMKLGQMLSFVSDEIPPEYRAALAALQASAPPLDFALLRDTVERELGRPLERAFARFDLTPLASASIGQVHRAQLPTGEEVVVKVQYPGVSTAIAADLANAAVLYRMVTLLYPAVDPAPVVDELRARLTEELDYVTEAKSQRAFAALYRGHPFIRIPEVFDSHSSAHVLTSEFVDGRRYADLLAAPEAERSRVGEILYRFVFGSIRFGVFNGDPHPGNYLFDEQSRMVFLDFGCVKYFAEEMLDGWRALVTAHLLGDKPRFRQQLIALGFFKPPADPSTDELYDFFGAFYEPFQVDRTFTYTREYSARSSKHMFATGEFAALGKIFNMPRDFVFVNRIQWGVVSILAQLGATGNWHRIQREYLFDSPPSTELGRLDEEHFARWRAERGLVGSPFLMTREGIVRRQPPPARAATR